MIMKASREKMNIEIIQKHQISQMLSVFLCRVDGSEPSKNTSGNRSAIKDLEKNTPTESSSSRTV